MARDNFGITKNIQNKDGSLVTNQVVKGVMLRPGYQIELFVGYGWQGEKETIVGAYEPGDESDEKLRC